MLILAAAALCAALALAAITLFVDVRTAFTQLCGDIAGYITTVLGICCASVTGFLLIGTLLLAAVLSSATLVYDNRTSAAEQRVFTAYLKPMYAQIARPALVWFDSWWRIVAAWWNFVFSMLPRKFFWDQVVLVPLKCPDVAIGMEEVYDAIPDFGLAFNATIRMLGNAITGHIDTSGPTVAHYLTSSLYSILRGVGDAFACWCAWITYGFDVLANAVADSDIVAAIATQLDAWQMLIAQFFQQFYNVPSSLANIVTDILHIIRGSSSYRRSQMGISYPAIISQESLLVVAQSERTSDYQSLWNHTVQLLRSFVDGRLFAQKQAASAGFLGRAWLRGATKLGGAIVHGLHLPKYMALRVNATLTIGPALVQGITGSLGALTNFLYSFLRADVPNMKADARDVFETLTATCSDIAGDIRRLEGNASLIPYLNTSEHICRAIMRIAGTGIDASIDIRTLEQASQFDMSCAFGELRAVAESIRDETNVFFGRIPSLRGIAHCLLLSNNKSACKSENGTTAQWDAAIGALTNLDIAGFLEAATGLQFDNFTPGSPRQPGGMFDDSVGRMYYGPLNVIITAAEYARDVSSKMFDEAAWIRADNYSDSFGSAAYRLSRAAAAAQTDCLFDALINTTDAFGDVESNLVNEASFAVMYVAYVAVDGIIKAIKRDIPALGNVIGLQWDPSTTPILFRINISFSLVDSFDSILGSQIPRPGDFYCDGELQCASNSTLGNMSCNDNLFFDKYDCNGLVCTSFLPGGVLSCPRFSNGSNPLSSITTGQTNVTWCQTLACVGGSVHTTASSKVALKKFFDLFWRLLYLSHFSCTDKALMQTDIDMGAVIDEVILILSGRIASHYAYKPVQEFIDNVKETTDDLKPNSNPAPNPRPVRVNPFNYLKYEKGTSTLFKAISRMSFEIMRYGARVIQVSNVSAWAIECGTGYAGVNLSEYYTEEYARIEHPNPNSGQPRYRSRRALQCGLTDPADDRRLADVLQDTAQSLAFIAKDFDQFINSLIHALPLLCNNQYESDKLVNFTRLFAETFSSLASVISVTVQTLMHPMDETRVLFEGPLLHMQNIFFALAESMPIIDNITIPVWGTSTEIAPFVARGAFYHGLVGLGLTANSLAVAALRALMRDPAAPTFLAEDNIYAPVDKTLGEIHDRITLMLNGLTTNMAYLQLVDPSLLKMHNHQMYKWADLIQSALTATLELAIPQRTECACVLPNGHISPTQPDYARCAGLEGDVHCATRLTRIARAAATGGSCACFADEYAREWGRFISMYISMSGRGVAVVRQFANLFASGLHINDNDLAADAAIVQRFVDLDNATYEAIARVGSMVGSVGDGAMSIFSGYIDSLYSGEAEYLQRGLGDFLRSTECEVARVPYALRKFTQALSMNFTSSKTRLPYTWDLGNLLGSLGQFVSEAYTLIISIITTLISPANDHTFSVSCNTFSTDNTLGKRPTIAAVFDSAEQVFVNLGNFISSMFQLAPNVKFSTFGEKLGKLVAALCIVIVRAVQLVLIGVLTILGDIPPLTGFISNNFCQPPNAFVDLLSTKFFGSIEDLLFCIADFLGLISSALGSLCHSLVRVFHMVFVDPNSPLAKIVRAAMTFFFSVLQFFATLGSDGFTAAIKSMSAAFWELLKVIYNVVTTLLSTLVNQVMFRGYMLGSGQNRFYVTDCILHFGRCLISILHLPAWLRTTGTSGTVHSIRRLRTYVADSFDVISLSANQTAVESLMSTRGDSAHARKLQHCADLLKHVSEATRTAFEQHAAMDTGASISIFVETDDPEAVFAEYVYDIVSHGIAAHTMESMQQSDSSKQRHATPQELSAFVTCFIQSTNDAQARFNRDMIQSRSVTRAKQKKDIVPLHAAFVKATMPESNLTWLFMPPVLAPDFNETAVKNATDRRSDISEPTTRDSDAATLFQKTENAQQLVDSVLKMTTAFAISTLMGPQIANEALSTLYPSDAVFNTEDHSIVEFAADLGNHVGDQTVRALLPDDMVTWNSKGHSLKTNVIGGAEDWIERVKHGDLSGRSVLYMAGDDALTAERSGKLAFKEQQRRNSRAINLNDGWFKDLGVAISELRSNAAVAKMSYDKTVPSPKYITRPKHAALHEIKSKRADTVAETPQYILSKSSPYERAFDDAIVAEAVRRRLADLQEVKYDYATVNGLQQEAREALRTARTRASIMPTSIGKSGGDALKSRDFDEDCFAPGVDLIGKLSKCIGPHDMTPWSKDLPIGMCGLFRDPAPCHDRNPPNDPIELVEFVGNNADLIDFPGQSPPGVNQACPSWYTNCSGQDVQFYPLCPGIDERCTGSEYFDNNTRWLWYHMCNVVCTGPANSDVFNSLCQVDNYGKYAFVPMRYFTWRSSSIGSSEGSTATQNPYVQNALFSLVYSYVCTQSGNVYTTTAATTPTTYASKDTLNSMCGYDYTTYPPSVYAYINANALLSLSTQYMFPGMVSIATNSSAADTCLSLAIGSSRSVCQQCAMHRQGAANSIVATLANIKANIGTQLINIRASITHTTPSTTNASLVYVSGTLTGGSKFNSTLNSVISQLIMPIVEDWFDAMCNSVSGLCIQVNQSVCSNTLKCTGLVVDTARTLVSSLQTPCASDTDCEQRRYQAYCSMLSGIGETPCVSFDVLQNDPMSYTLDGPSAAACSQFCQYEVHVPESATSLSSASVPAMMNSAPQSCTTQTALCFTRRFDGTADTAPFGTCVCPPSWALENDSEILAIHNWTADASIGALEPYQCSMPITDTPRSALNVPNFLPFICGGSSANGGSIANPVWSFFVDVMDLISTIDFGQTNLTDDPDANGVLPTSTKFCAALCPDDPWCEHLFFLPFNASDNDTSSDNISVSIDCPSLLPSAVEYSDIAGFTLTQRAKRVLCVLFNHNTTSLSRSDFPIASMLSDAKSAGASTVSSDGYMQYATACPNPGGSWANGLGRWGNTVPYYVVLDNGNYQVMPINGYTPGRRTVCVMDAPAHSGWDRADLPGECRELAVRVKATGQQMMTQSMTDNSDCPMDLDLQTQDTYSPSPTYRQQPRARHRMGTTCTRRDGITPIRSVAKPVTKGFPAAGKMPSLHTIAPVPFVMPDDKIEVKERDTENFVCDAAGLCILKPSSRSDAQKLEDETVHECTGVVEPSLQNPTGEETSGVTRTKRYMLHKHEILKQNALSALAAVHNAEESGDDTDRIVNLLKQGASWLADYYANISRSLLALSMATSDTMFEETQNTRDIELPIAPICNGMLLSNRLCLTGATWGYANFTYNWDIEDATFIVPGRASMCPNPSYAKYNEQCIILQYEHGVWEYVTASVMAEIIDMYSSLSPDQCGATWPVECMAAPSQTRSARRQPMRYIERLAEARRHPDLAPNFTVAATIGAFSNALSNLLSTIIMRNPEAVSKRMEKAPPGTKLSVVEGARQENDEFYTLGHILSQVAGELIDDIEENACQIDTRQTSERSVRRSMTTSVMPDNVRLTENTDATLPTDYQVREPYSWRRQKRLSGAQCSALESEKSSSSTESTELSSSHAPDTPPRSANNVHAAETPHENGFYEAWFGARTAETVKQSARARDAPVSHTPQRGPRHKPHAPVESGACKRVQESRERRKSPAILRDARTSIGRRGYREDCRLLCQYNWADLFSRSCINDATQYVANSTSMINAILAVFPQVCAQFNIPNDTTWSYDDDVLRRSHMARTTSSESGSGVNASDTTPDWRVGTLGSFVRTYSSTGAIESFVRNSMLPTALHAVKRITNYPISLPASIVATSNNSITLSHAVVTEFANLVNLEHGGYDGPGSANVTDMALRMLHDMGRNKSVPITPHEFSEIFLDWLVSFDIDGDDPNATLGLLYYLTYVFLPGDCRRITNGAAFGSFAGHDFIPVVGHINLWSPFWIFPGLALPVNFFKESVRVGDAIFDRDYVMPVDMVKSDPGCACSEDYRISESHAAFEACQPTFYHCAHYGMILPPDLLLYAIARIYGNGPFASGATKRIIGLLTLWHSDTGFIDEWVNYSSKPLAYREAVDSCVFSVGFRWTLISLWVFAFIIFVFKFAVVVSWDLIKFLLTVLIHVCMFTLTFLLTIPGGIESTEVSSSAVELSSGRGRRSKLSKKRTQSEQPDPGRKSLDGGAHTDTDPSYTNTIPQPSAPAMELPPPAIVPDATNNSETAPVSDAGSSRFPPLDNDQSGIVQRLRPSGETYDDNNSTQSTVLNVGMSSEMPMPRIPEQRTLTPQSEFGVDGESEDERFMESVPVVGRVWSMMRRMRWHSE